MRFTKFLYIFAMKGAMLCIMFLMSVNMAGQLKVRSTGKVIVGEDKDNDDLYDALTMSVFGKGCGMLRTGSKLALGDFGRWNYYGWNVFIGEFGDDDTDKMWLHGKNGFYLTCTGRTANTTASFDNTANYVVAYFNTSENAFRFNVPVYNNRGMLIASDKRFKTNIQQIGNAMSALNKLNAVSFDYRFPEEDAANEEVSTSSSPRRSVKKLSSSKGESSLNDSVDIVDVTEKNPTDSLSVDMLDTMGVVFSEISEKEERAKAEAGRYEQLRTQTDQNHIGLIAQEAQAVLPELVKADTAGYLYVDYIGLIPVIIEALKEQQTIINAQSLDIKALKEQYGKCCRTCEDTTGSDIVGEEGHDGAVAEVTSENRDEPTLSTSLSNTTTATAILYQNIPNPFSSQTEIRYYVPLNAKDAFIYVFSLTGNLLLTKPITGTGSGSISIRGNELQPGRYLYSLVIDGVEVDSKRMILTDK